MSNLSYVSRFRHFSEACRQEFVSRLLPQRHFFPHRTYYLPKCGPDALYLAQKMLGSSDLSGHVELLIFADPSDLEQFPTELFFDDNLIWHRQQFGKVGHVAFAYLFVDGENLYGLNYVSDLVQRISRRPEYATRIEKRFHGWRHMLLNSILNFAVERGLRTIYSPTSELVMANTDRTRSVQTPLFERVYDRTVTERFNAAKANGWWIIDVRSEQHRLVRPERREEVIAAGHTVCICHDIERGLGHKGIDNERMEIADRIGPKALSEMIQHEGSADVKATYNVLGCFFNDVQKEIGAGGHCLAFHSYDHTIRPHWRLTQHYWRFLHLFNPASHDDLDARHLNQLYRCRLVDPRVRGFRPPQSRVTPEWDDFNLVLRNFEWCATSSRKVGDIPIAHDHLVKIPIHLDDFPLYKADIPFHVWEKTILEEVRSRDFVAVGLHDCYADLWLSYYQAFLEKLSRSATLKTMDTVANETILASAM